MVSVVLRQIDGQEIFYLKPKGPLPALELYTSSKSGPNPPLGGDTLIVSVRNNVHLQG